ncbi:MULTISPECIES: hypothetical protein [Vibrio]|uniref:hypothetical protein n=1 Tax=Vibrio TaxID=662 RepID=UPI0002FF7498|nr:hypothetical protein [Vibrio crassostreae]OEE91066.1 hypothetical protein A140_15540 [Vibrio crassostreae 9ZC88]
MFAELGKVAKVLIDSIAKIKNITDKRKYRQSCIDVISVYYVLKDIRDDAVKLLNACNWNPNEKISTLSELELSAFLCFCDEILRKQGERLYCLERKINSDQCLAFMDDELHRKLLEAIGHKSQRVVSLHGIASTLVIEAMLPSETPEDRVELIQRMSGLENDTLNLNEIRQEIDNFSLLLKQYKNYSVSLVDNPELVEITELAKSNAMLGRV